MRATTSSFAIVIIGLMYASPMAFAECGDPYEDQCLEVYNGLNACSNGNPFDSQLVSQNGGKAEVVGPKCGTIIHDITIDVIDALTGKKVKLKIKKGTPCGPRDDNGGCATKSDK